ncbi:MAG TPA: energy transducer TonB [Bacteroidia bacterium]|nr:energy transducer TonB [Bacteroidia bacterium]
MLYPIKNISLTLIFLFMISSNASAQDDEVCGMDINEAWGGDTAALNAFLKTCGRIDTVSFDEHNKPTKTNAHHQTIKMVMNTGKVVRVDSIFFVADVMPQFPEGERKWIEYLRKTLQYPSKAKANKVSGRVYVQFVIERDGKVSRAKIIRGIGSGCEEEALRVIKAMPKWTPGKMRGEPVQVQMSMPVNFKL